MEHTVENLFEVKGLKKYFPVYGGIFVRKVGEVRAVDNVDFEIKTGEILGLVGESGCGKSTVGRLLLRLINPTDGAITFKHQNIVEFSDHDLLHTRKEMQMVFQDPFSSLNPRIRIGETIADSLVSHNLYDRKGRKNRVRKAMELVGLNPSLETKYPHEFSGGDRQRIGIASAIAVNPEFIFFDEPVSALDLSAQAQILNLIKYIRDSLHITALVVAHNLSVVAYISDRVAVMYLGNIVEMGETAELYNAPKHPYTQALMSAIQVIDPEEAREKKEIELQGEIPSPMNVPSGCKFHPRCQHFIGDVCTLNQPVLRDIGGAHYVACHLYDKMGANA